MDDLPGLKSFVGDFIMLDQYTIIKEGESVNEEQVNEFYEWLIKNTNVKFDGKMLTPEVLRKQIRLYLGAKKILESRKENIIEFL